MLSEASEVPGWTIQSGALLSLFIIDNFIFILLETIILFFKNTQYYTQFKEIEECSQLTILLGFHGRRSSCAKVTEVKRLITGTISKLN